MALLPLTALALCLVISTGESRRFTFVPAQSDLYVHIGGDAEFSLRPTGFVASGKCFFKGENIISWSGTTPFFHPQYKSRAHVSLESTTLVLRSVKESDEGVYTVTLVEEDTGAQASANITLHAREPVANVTLRANESELADHLDSVLLTCSARGTQLKREWLFNNHTVQQNERISISGDTLLIAPVKWTDSGFYKCIVSNGLNSESDWTDVSVGTIRRLPDFSYTVTILIIVAVLLAACFFGGLCAWLIAKKTRGANPAPRTNNDTDRIFGRDNTLAANAGDEWHPYENLPGIAQGRSSNEPVEDHIYMGLKLEDRSVYGELQK